METSMSDRKSVEVFIGNESFHDIIDGHTPDMVIDIMKTFKQRHESLHVFFKIRYYGYDGGMELEIWERRLETDKEYKKRLAVEAKEAEKKILSEQEQKNKEFREYQRLKKKFEKVK